MAALLPPPLSNEPPELSEDDASHTPPCRCGGSAWHAGQATRATALVDQAHRQVADPRLIAEFNHFDGDIHQRRGWLIEGGRILIEPTAAAAG